MSLGGGAERPRKLQRTEPDLPPPAQRSNTTLAALPSLESPGTGAESPSWRFDDEFYMPKNPSPCLQRAESTLTAASASPSSFSENIRVDMTDEGDHLEVLADVPGYTKDNVSISVVGGLEVTIVLTNGTSRRAPGAAAADAAAYMTTPSVAPSTTAPVSSAGSARPAKNYLLRERTLRLHRVIRTIRLPCCVDPTKTTARVADGVLRITLMKMAPKIDVHIE